MFKKLLLLSCLCPLLSWAADDDQLSPWLRPGTKDSDPRPNTYPTTCSHDPIPYKMKFFHDTRHWYICFEDKFFMHDPECPCHIHSKYITYDLDEHNNPVKNSYKLTQQVHPAWDYHP